MVMVNWTENISGFPMLCLVSFYSALQSCEVSLTAIDKKLVLTFYDVQHDGQMAGMADI